MQTQYLKVGKVVGTRGLNGEIKVQSWCDTPEVFCKIKNFYWDLGINKIKINSLKVYKSMVLVRIDNINRPEDATSILNKIIYADKDDIVKKDDSYFIDDLIGSNVMDASTNECYGVLSDVLKLSCNDVYKVISPDGKEFLVPAISEFISSIDVDKKEILINPIEGIFE